MKRAVIVAVLATIALAPPASAAPIPIRHDRDASAIALAGPDVVVLSESAGHGVKLVALPRTGGRARALLSVARGSLVLDDGALAASARRVAAIVEVEGTTERPVEYRVYSGPPSGPLQLVRRTLDPNGDAWTPLVVSVDGDRVLLLEGADTNSAGDEDEDTGPVRAQILDASGWTPIPWATGTRAPVAIAGPYAAVAAFDPARIELADLATGTPLGTLTGTRPDPFTVDLTADGRIAAGVQGAIKTASPGQPEQTVADSRKLTFPRFAGGSLAAFNEASNKLELVGAAGMSRSLGPPSLIRTDLDADEQGVAWLFNGCVRYEPLGTSAPAVVKNPCPASEVALWGIGPSSKLRGNTATAQVKCVASAAGRCRGRLVARLDPGKPIVGRGTFDIPIGGRWRKVPVHFDRATVAKFRRQHGGSVVINAIVRDGTVGAGADYSSEFAIKP